MNKFAYNNIEGMQTTISREGNAVNVSVNGRLSTDEAERFIKDLDPLMKEDGLQITMDLSGLEFISSAGIRCFMLLLMSCQSKGSSLVLTNLTPQIRNIFSLTALLDKFGIK